MSHSLTKRVLPFSCEGRFLGFVPNAKGKLNLMLLSTAEGERCLKVPKEIRYLLGHGLSTGVWLQVSGEHKIDLRSGEEKWTVYRVVPQRPVEANGDPSAQVTPLSEPPSTPPALAGKCSLLICQKSDCQKRGGWALLDALETSLKHHPQGDQIRIQKVGCMKNCKAGPNLVVMPDKTHYSHVSAAGIPALIERHFPISKTDDLQNAKDLVAQS
jgi:(2Fe-2S) ferredoxin